MQIKIVVMLIKILLVGIGSCAGGIARYLLSLLIPSVGKGFPLATFIINVAGSLLIGMLVGLLSKIAPAHSGLFLLLVTGFCGGFTTFSTFSNESLIMLQNGYLTGFILYVSGSMAFGISATFVGYRIISALYN